MEKKYQCKIWAKELGTGKKCQWVSRVTLETGKIVIHTSLVPVAIPADLGKAVADIVSKADNLTEWHTEFSVIQGTSAEEESDHE